MTRPISSATRPSTTAKTVRNTNGRRLRVAAWYSHRNIGPENMLGTFGSMVREWTATHFTGRVAERRMQGDPSFYSG